MMYFDVRLKSEGAMYRTVLVAAFWGLAVVGAPTGLLHAGLIDFQSLAGLVEGSVVPNLTADGVVVSFENAIVAKYGGPVFAFTVGETLDTGSQAPFSNSDNVFITDALGVGTSNQHAIPSGPVVMTFDTPVTALRFLAVDIDLGEEVTAVVKNQSNAILDSIVTSVGGDGLNTLFDFGSVSGIRSLSIAFSKVQSNGNAAIGIDNLAFTAVPEPATAVLWSVLGIAGAVAAWRRRACPRKR
jgi:hypothetical protein